MEKIQKIINNLGDTNDELKSDLSFISEYIDDELVDKEIMSKINRLFSQPINENKHIIGTVRLRKSTIKNIIGRINTKRIETI